MLDIMRRSVNGFVGILLIALLVFAFALWGIADTFTGFSNSVLAKVGDQEIERVEFQLRYSQQLQALQQQFGTTISPEQARDLGIDRQVLRNMLGSAALHATANDLGLAQSDEALAEQIVNDPNFAGPNGNFDEPTFRSTLARNGLSEALFVKDQRNFNIREQLSAASYDRALMPEMLREKLFAHFLERRIAKYLIVTLDETDEVGEPSQAELETFFEQSKLRFTQDERRTAAMLIVTPARFIDGLVVSQEELREEYDLSVNEFTTPEERAIDQLVLADDDIILQVRDLIAKKKSFVEIVKAAGQTLDNTDLGWVEQSDIISVDLSQQAFNMSKGDVSDVIDGPLGSVVLRVRDIKLEIVEPFEAVAEKLRTRLATDRAIDDMIAFSETVEDERAGGVTLQEIGQRFDLDVVTVANFNRDGELENGSRSAELERFTGLAASLYDAAIGEELPVLETADGSFVWAELKSVRSSQVPQLDAVRDDVTEQWKISEQTKLLEALAEHLVTLGNLGNDFNTVAKGFTRTPLTSEPMTRQVSNETFSKQAVEKLFAVEKDKYTWAPVGFGRELVVMQAVDVIAANTGDSEARELIFEGELRKYRADLTAQFIQNLRTTYGVKVYEDSIEQAVNQLVNR
ncbi:SurA N-terminal domain-containing protein [Alphaproteobacteria bacterium]|nr:SurA N-terminal domain-containing protein [Alphaproteobacteria bacterium]